MSISTRIQEHFSGPVADKKIAVWGVSNENGNLDQATCQAIEWLVENGAHVAVHDDTHRTVLQARFGSSVEFPENKWAAVQHADAVIVASQFTCSVDAGRLAWAVAERTLFDVNATVDQDSLQYSDFAYYALGCVRLERDAAPVITPFRKKEQPVFATATLAVVG